MPTFDLAIHSPRWGHQDTYSFDFERDALTIRFAPRRAVCTWRENQDPAWSGEAFESMLRNDHVCPPDGLSGLVAHVWKAWRADELADEAAGTELQALITWLNAITQAKPKTEFWGRYF